MKVPGQPSSATSSDQRNFVDEGNLTDAPRLRRLQQTTDPKLSKSRMHLDLRTPDLVAEVHRLVDLGAKTVTDAPMVEHDWHWHVRADPDGNEFCVLQPPTDDPWPTTS